jgi:putative transposase
VLYLQDRLGYSCWRICRAIGQAWSSQRYQKKVNQDQRSLVAAMHRLAVLRPRFGYRRITACLQQEGWRVNDKRVHRLWKEEGLQIRKRQHKRRRTGSGANACHRRRPRYKDHVWGYDFVSERTERGGQLKLLNVVDEFTRECLTIEVARSFTGQDVVRVLQELFDLRGRPRYLRSGSGSRASGRCSLNRAARGRTDTLKASTASFGTSASTASCS